VSEGNELAAAVADVARSSRRVGVEAAFRATVEQRLRGLESELAEVKTRLNGLLFFLAGAFVVEALLRLVAP
jgi:hypothetical protein